MKTITQTVLFIFLLTFSLAVFGQSKSITGENYYSALKEANSKTERQIRKRVQIQKLYEDGKPTETITDTTEYLPPDKSRWFSIDEENGKVTNRIEQITIGNTVYRKTDNGEWITKNKGDFGSGFSGTDNSSREFFIEEISKGKEKFQVLIEKTTNYNKTFFDEDKTWINEKGIIVKRIRTTSENDLKNVVSYLEINYDYNMKTPKIEPPIK